MRKQPAAFWIATATGPRTVFGDIAEQLASRAPSSEFELGLRRFSLLILRTTVVLVLFILLMGIALKRDAVESVIFAVALGVGLTPEFLPMITSVTLARGALRMARDQVIVKRLPAIQNFGSIDTLCCDKTGTLTTGVLAFERSLDPAGTPSDRPLTLAYVNSRLETGIRNPLEAAILQQRIDASGYTKVDEIPFDFERRRLSVVTDGPETGAHRLLMTKGAPEAILALSTEFEVDQEVRPLDPSARQRCERVLEQLSAGGRKVLAVAYRCLDRRSAYSREDERDLVLAGFVSFVDPVVEGVKEVLSGLKADGVTVKILTGDSELAARHVCATVKVDDRRMVTGDDIARLDDAALQRVAEDASVFTRVSPAQKNRSIVLLHVFHAGERLFHTGWFVESLATQTLVLFIIRTMGNPIRSRPSRALTATTLGIATFGAVLPVTPLAAMMGFSPLPPAYYGFLALATVTYLLLVEVAKRRLVRRLALD